MSNFKHPSLRELTQQQVRFALPSRRIEQVAKAETLLAETELQRTYPYSYVCWRLTDFRPTDVDDPMISGSELRHDLGLFIHKVESSLPPLPIELAAEPMLSLEEVGKQFNVSTKTISRWRLQGLPARRVIRNGRRELGFPKSAVETFSASHRNQIDRGAKFHRMSDADKDDIVLSARRLAANGTNLTETIRTIADRLGRSMEAIRYTIKNFDRYHPDAAVFPERTGPLDAASKMQIFHAFQEGRPMKLISQTYKRPAADLYRVIHTVKAEQYLGATVDYMNSLEFDDPALEKTILGPMPDQNAFFEKVATMRPPKDVDAHMAYLYERPLLNREQEAHLFRKMNFLKHKLAQFQQTLDPAKARAADIRKIEAHHDSIKQVRDLLIECNQRLVHNLATKHLQPGQNLDELKSDANVSIMRAVEKFDYSRGNKFSTYATWAVMKNFARSIPDENTRKQRYMTGTDELFDSRADIRTDEQEVLAQADQARAKVNRLLDYLDPRTREVIKMRTGIDGSEEMTLEQIGKHFGITKERVRQINVRGMKQLREKAAEEHVELP